MNRLWLREFPNFMSFSVISSIIPIICRHICLKTSQHEIKPLIMQAPGCLSPLKVYGIVWLCCDISLKEPTLALEITVFIHWLHLFRRLSFSKERKNYEENYGLLLHINLMKSTVTINPEKRRTHFPGLACSSERVSFHHFCLGLATLPFRH